MTTTGGEKNGEKKSLTPFRRPFKLFGGRRGAIRRRGSVPGVYGRPVGGPGAGIQPIKHRGLGGAAVRRRPRAAFCLLSTLRPAINQPGADIVPDSQRKHSG